MRDEEKTKEQIMKELAILRRRVTELEFSLEKTLEERETRFARIQYIARLGIWDWNLEKNTLWWSDVVYRIFGLDHHEFGGTYDSFLEFVHPEDRECVKQAIDAALYLKKPFTLEHRIVLPDGSEKIICEQAEVIFNDTGTPIRMFGTVQDITESLHTETELKLADIVFKNTLEGIAITNAEGTLISVNPAFTKITGYSASEAIGKNPRILKSYHHDDVFYKNMWNTLLEKGQWQGEIWNRRKDGEAYLEWLTIITIKDGDGKPCNYVSVFRDITDIRQKEEHILHMAYHDPLTNLPNRLLFHDRLQQAISSALRHPKIIAIMFIDLDRFKIINDTLGHNVGDMLLQSVALRLKGAVRQNDTVSRLGGDEFVILLSEIEKAQDAALVAQKILHELSLSFTVYGHELNITASIGISVYPDDGNDVQTLMKNADTAMYHAKEHGKNAYQFYKENMNTVLFEHMLLENSLRRAIERNEFQVYYQPKIDMSSGKVSGMEALLRWQHSEIGLINPSQFIPIAEETGLIIPVGEWILRAACKQCMVWKEAGFPSLSVAVNLSSRQLKHQELLRIIKEVLDETGFDPEYLELELTESVIMHQAEKTIETLHKLKAMGIRISIDDFGTGYSSLSYLKRFPIDKLKIDQSFVHDVTTNEDDSSIVTAIIAIAQSLKLKIVAEGVETIDQLAFLKSMQCDEVQGYYFSRPLHTDAFTTFLRENQGFKVSF